MLLMPQLQPYMSLIRKCPLLKDVPEEQYGSAFACIRTRICQAPKDSIVLALGDPFRYAYYLLEGCLVSTFQTATYDQITLNLFLPGDLLGESFACIPDSVSTIQLSASCDSVYLQFDLQPLLGKNQCGTCGKALDPAWTVCPYCATPLPGIAARRSGRTAIPGQGGASGRPAAGAPARGAEESARPAGGHARQ